MFELYNKQNVCQKNSTVDNTKENLDLTFFIYSKELLSEPKLIFAS